MLIDHIRYTDVLVSIIVNLKHNNYELGWLQDKMLKDLTTTKLVNNQLELI